MDERSYINPMDFVVEQIQDDLHELSEIVRLFIAQREGVEAESLEELREKLVTKFWDEVQSLESSAKRDDND